MDIETAADHTSESRAKLAKMKSRGLICTLVTEAINLDKSWDEIKDLLWLKLCSADIHTYTSHFMEIQQWEKKSLAGYIHWFKTEAKRWNFMNDAATVRIFIKGLKNAHSLATHIYEKGPQTLTDVISEVEQLNAVQQLTAMIIPPSTVNMMSSEEYHCFQCQEQGHITWNCPNIRCFKCDEYGHIVMDCPHRIPPLGTQQNITNPDLTEAALLDQVQGTTVKTGTGKVVPCHNLIFTGNAAQVIMIHTEATPGHHIGVITATPGIVHNTQAPHIEIIAINPTMTHHTDPTADHPHTEVLQLTTPEIVVDHIHVHPMNPQGKIHIGHTHNPADQEENYTPRRTWGWK